MMTEPRDVHEELAELKEAVEAEKERPDYESGQLTYGREVWAAQQEQQRRRVQNDYSGWIAAKVREHEAFAAMFRLELDALARRDV